MTVLVGCSGWSYDDWIGRFYPVELAKKKCEWLAYYAQFFSTVEINSTFYRPPGGRQVQSWIKKVKDRPGGFEYSVKMPGLVTHQALVDSDEEKALFWTASLDQTCLRPLSDAGLLGGVLLQLSPYFKSGEPAIRRLVLVLDSLAPGGYDLAVEFRNESWFDEGRGKLDAETLEVLKERNVANVLIDGPGHHPKKEQTADHAYIRFHGRNYDIWYGGEKEDDYRLDRYDYLYKEDQLKLWVPFIEAAELKAAKARVYFNNHARAKAAKNAFLLMDLLGIEHTSREIRLQDQFTLGQY